jgi:hypothetical protein
MQHSSSSESSSCPISKTIPLFLRKPKIYYVIRPCPEVDEFNPNLSHYFFTNNFNTDSSLTPRFLHLRNLSNFPKYPPYQFHFSLVRATYLFHLRILDFIVLIMFGGQHKSWTYSKCIFCALTLHLHQLKCTDIISELQIYFLRLSKMYTEHVNSTACCLTSTCLSPSIGNVNTGPVASFTAPACNSTKLLLNSNDQFQSKVLLCHNLICSLKNTSEPHKHITCLSKSMILWAIGWSLLTVRYSSYHRMSRWVQACFAIELPYSGTRRKEQSLYLRN